MNCKNCNEIIDRNFCGNCGQKSTVDRINFSNFIGELSESVFKLTKGFYLLLKSYS